MSEACSIMAVMWYKIVIREHQTQSWMLLSQCISLRTDSVRNFLWCLELLMLYLSPDRCKLHTKKSNSVTHFDGLKCILLVDMLINWSQMGQENFKTLIYGADT